MNPYRMHAVVAWSKKEPQGLLVRELEILYFLPFIGILGRGKYAGYLSSESKPENSHHLWTVSWPFLFGVGVSKETIAISVHLI